MIINKYLKLAVFLVLALTLTFAMSTIALAADEDFDGRGCTSFYFGKDTTDNGSYIWGRTEDVGATFGKLFNIEPAATYNIDPVKYYNYDGDWRNYNGDMFVAGSWNAGFSTFTGQFRWPYPAKTLRYTYNCDSLYNERNAPRPYAEVGMNEKGVSISATESLSGMKSAITSRDPSVSRANGGITEVDVTSLILMQAQTARGACELLAKVIDTVGAGGREGLFLSDPNEVWYFQWLTGHQYVAAKCPPDMIGFSPNITGNVGPNGVVDITDTANFIVSPRLIEIAVSAGVYVGDPADPGNMDKIKMCDSYGSTTDHRSGRMRTGWGLLYGYTTNAEITANVPGNVYMDFFLKPRASKNYSLYEIMRMFAGRGQGTDWVAASSISTASTVECTVYELRPGMPAEIATVQWMTMAPPEFGVFLPYYNNLVKQAYEKMYSPDAGPNNPDTSMRGYNNANPDNNSMYWVFRELFAQCNLTNLTERARIGDGVLDFWKGYQKALIADQALIDKYMLKVLKNEGRAKAEEVATTISMALCEQTYEHAKRLLAEVKAFKAGGGSGNFMPQPNIKPSPTPYVTPLYAGLLIDEVIPSAKVEKLTGNKNNLTVTVTECYLDGATKVFNEKFSIDNNAIGIYTVGNYNVYVDTKGNDQIRQCYIIK